MFTILGLDDYINKTIVHKTNFFINTNFPYFFPLFSGLCGRSMSLYQLNALRTPATLLSGSRCVSLKIISPVPDNQSYEDKNEKLKREMSPHLTIYKPQLTSMLSITHRFTGMFNAQTINV